MTKFDHNWADAYFNHGVDVVNRRVFIGDIDEGSVSTAIKAMYMMDTQSKTEPCELFISSYGGDMYEALALYDVIKTLKCPIYTFAFGKCQSAAPLVLAAGEPGHRWVAQHVALMHHDFAGEIEGTGSNLAASVKHLEEVAETWVRLLAEHSNKDFRFWQSRAKKPADFFFNAEQAIEWGVADDIWSEKD